MYIGRNIDSINNISTLDNLSFNGSDTTFNLTQNSVAFVPVSADALQIQIDGVIQSGNYTVSGSTVTFDFTPSGSSVCNGIKHFGVGVLTSVSDGAVTSAKLGNNSVGITQLNVSDGSNGQALTTNGSGTLAFSSVGVSGISSSSSSTALSIDANGLVTKPLQCGVVWKPTNNSGSITADTTHTIGSGNSTEIIDRNGDFSGNTFTAPVTGLYFLSMNLYVNSYDHDNNWSGAWIDTSNRRYQMWFLAGNALSVDGSVQISGGSVADMDAGDTAVWQFRNDQGTQQPVINQERTVLGAFLLG